MTAREGASRDRLAGVAGSFLLPRQVRSAEAQQRLHNMSAPPRATIAFRLVTQRAAAADALPATGLRWVCRIDVPAVFWPLPEGVARDIAQYADWQQTLEPQRRLLAQALAEEGGLERPDAALAIRVDAMPAEAVLDALRDVALRVDPVALGLPTFGLLRPARGTKSRQSTGRMRLAVAVLARRRGGIFLRAADPLPLSSVNEPFDLWTPEPAACPASDSRCGLALPPQLGVVPAQAGTQCLRATSRWVPASAGTTGEERGGSSKNELPNGAPE